MRRCNDVVETRHAGRLQAVCAAVHTAVEFLLSGFGAASVVAVVTALQAMFDAVVIGLEVACFAVAVAGCCPATFMYGRQRCLALSVPLHPRPMGGPSVWPYTWRLGDKRLTSSRQHGLCFPPWLTTGHCVGIRGRVCSRPVPRARARACAWSHPLEDRQTAMLDPSCF